MEHTRAHLWNALSLFAQICTAIFNMSGYFNWWIHIISKDKKHYINQAATNWFVLKENKTFGLTNPVSVSFSSFLYGFCWIWRSSNTVAKNSPNVYRNKKKLLLHQKSSLKSTTFKLWIFGWSDMTIGLCLTTTAKTEKVGNLWIFNVTLWCTEGEWPAKTCSKVLLR